MRIEITEEMWEALARMRARDAEARDTQRTEGERRLSMVYRGWAASDLARLVDEAVEQADREEARRREAEQRQRADEWALHESYTIDDDEGEEARGG